MSIHISEKSIYLSCTQWKGENIYVRFKYNVHDDKACHSCINIIEVFDENMNPIDISHIEIKEMEKQWQKIIREVPKTRRRKFVCAKKSFQKLINKYSGAK